MKLGKWENMVKSMKQFNKDSINNKRLWCFRIENYAKSDLGKTFYFIHHTLLFKKGMEDSEFAFSVGMSASKVITNVIAVAQGKTFKTEPFYKKTFLYAPNFSVRITTPDLFFEKTKNNNINKQSQLFGKKHEWKYLKEEQIDLLSYILNDMPSKNKEGGKLTLLPQDSEYKPWYSNNHLSCRSFTCQFRDNPRKYKTFRIT